MKNIANWMRTQICHMEKLEMQAKSMRTQNDYDTDRWTKGIWLEADPEDENLFKNAPPERDFPAEQVLK